MKAVRILRRNIGNAFKSIFRNLNLSFASIICSTITLMLVSLAFIIAANVNEFTKELEDELTISIWLVKGTTKEQEQLVKDELMNLDNVDKNSIILKNKEELRKELMNEDETYKNVMGAWTEETNPLMSEIILTVDDIHNIKDTIEEIKKVELVYSVDYGEDIVPDLVGIFDGVKIGSICIIGALIVVTIFLICNTIKLTIFSRKNEIDIMRLVGTSNTVIKLPFVIEGLFLGIIGAIIPIIITVYGYFIIYDKLNGFFILKIVRMIKPMPLLLYDIALLLIIGAIVGMIGSYRSVRKYLKI